MVQSLDFIRYVRSKPDELRKVEAALICDTSTELIIDRHKLTFDPESETVVVERKSPEYIKIIACRIPYNVLKRLLENDWEDMTGFEWL